MVFYPSDWLYNASVIGLAEAIADYFEESDVSFNDDGTITIADSFLGHLFKNLKEVKGDLPPKLPVSPSSRESANFASRIPLMAWLFLRRAADHIKEGNAFKKEREKMQATDLKDPLSVFNAIRPKYFFKDGPFVNAIGAGTKDVAARVAELFGFPEELEEYSLHCSFCGNSFRVPKEKRRLFIDNIFVGYAGASAKEFPNAYWDFKPSTPICPACSVAIFFHIFALQQSPDRQFFFVNSPSFALSRELMRQMGIFSKKPDGVFFRNIVDRLTKIAAIQTGWGSMGIEIYRIVGDPPGKYQEVKVTKISHAIVDKLTASPSIGGYLRSINSTGLYEAFIAEDYGKLFQLLYLANKHNATGAKSSAIEIERLVGRTDFRAINAMAGCLPDLLYEGMGYGGEEMELKRIRSETREIFNSRAVRASQDGGEDRLLSSIGRIAYQLIEKTRLGNRLEANYLLTRTFTANGEPLPKSLWEIIATGSEEEFKLGVYAFIDTVAGILKETESQKVKEEGK